MKVLEIARVWTFCEFAGIPSTGATYVFRMFVRAVLPFGVPGGLPAGAGPYVMPRASGLVHPSEYQRRSAVSFRSLFGLSLSSGSQRTPES